MSSAAVARGKPSRSTSAIIADTTSGYHLLTIHGYSCTKDLPTEEKISSQPFTVGGHRWRIDYFPNGSCALNQSYISLSLILDEDAGCVKAKHSFCLAGLAEEKQAARLPLAKVATFCSRSRSDWKWSCFFKREELESSKHLTDDSFTFRCDITVLQDYRVEDTTVFVPVPPCDLRRHLGELLETEKGADVVFEVGGETVAAHRCVLAARSPVFSADLFGPMKEGNAVDGGVVRVEDMDAEVFKALLCFAYTGLLPETRKEDEDVRCQHLLVAADRYGMERLKLICEEKLCEYINLGTVANILALAELHHCKWLKKACFDFLATPANLRAVMATDSFQHLNMSCPSVILELMAMSVGALVE